jgi:hypothetical protein
MRGNALVLKNTWGGVRSGPGAARTILLFHTIGARPSKQTRVVGTTLGVYIFGLILSRIAQTGRAALRRVGVRRTLRAGRVADDRRVCVFTTFYAGSPIFSMVPFCKNKYKTSSSSSFSLSL